MTEGGAGDARSFAAFTAGRWRWLSFRDGRPKNATSDPASYMRERALARGCVMHIEQKLARRVRTERAARLLSEADSARMIDAIPTLAWCAQPGGFLKFVNRRWHDYTGRRTHARRHQQ